MDFRDQGVRCKICDVYHPEPTQILFDMHRNNLLVGKVVDVSDSGSQKEAFVIVQVEGIEVRSSSQWSTFLVLKVVR
jgi:hypothetical protein